MSSYNEARSWYSVTLDTNECLNLDQILKVFSSAITEEHAWSVIYQVDFSNRIGINKKFFDSLLASLDINLFGNPSPI